MSACVSESCLYVQDGVCVSADVPRCAQMSVNTPGIKASYFTAQLERPSHREGTQPARDPLGSQWDTGTWNLDLYGCVWM